MKCIKEILKKAGEILEENNWIYDIYVVLGIENALIVEYIPYFLNEEKKEKLVKIVNELDGVDWIGKESQFIIEGKDYEGCFELLDKIIKEVR